MRPDNCDCGIVKWTDKTAFMKHISNWRLSVNCFFALSVHLKMRIMQNASADFPELCLHCSHTADKQTPTFPPTHPISLGSAHEQGCGALVCFYKHTLQTAVKWVHPNWECLTRKHLNQLLNKRVHPFPPLITRATLYRHS